MVLKVPSPPPAGSPVSLNTLADHLRKIRLKRGLRQAEVAKILKVDKQTICNWESHRTRPTIIDTGRVCDFLGYDPFPNPDTLGDHMLKYRKLSGSRIKDAANRAGVDPSSWSAWESGRQNPSPVSETKIRTFLEDDSRERPRQ